jgi:hypothetical protein
MKAMTKLVRISWRRPCDKHESGYVSGILHRKVYSDDEVKHYIRNMQRLAEIEGHRREILDIEIYEKV